MVVSVSGVGVELARARWHPPTPITMPLSSLSKSVQTEGEEETYLMKLDVPSVPIKAEGVVVDQLDRCHHRAKRHGFARVGTLLLPPDNAWSHTRWNANGESE
jgi:hypothetical protein